MVVKSIQDLPDSLNDQEFALMSELFLGILPDEDIEEVERIISSNDLVISR